MKQTATFRVWRTEDGRYVGEGHLDAETLAAAVNGPLPDDFDINTFEATHDINLDASPTDDGASDAESDSESEKKTDPSTTEKPSPEAQGKRGKRGQADAGELSASKSAAEK